MRGALRRFRFAWLALGVMAAAAGGGFLANSIFHGVGSSSESDSVRDDFLKAVALHATATHSQETVIMATGELDQGVEALYVFDGDTGELTGHVMNKNGRFNIHYSYKGVLNDLQATAVKNPKFVMVTGNAALLQGGQTSRPARAVVYICEVSTGAVAAYGVTFIPGAIAQNRDYNDTFHALGKVQFRQAVVRPGG